MTRSLRVRSKGFENLGGSNGIRVWPPRVVIRHSRDEGIAIVTINFLSAIIAAGHSTLPDLGLTRELGFRQHAHVDQVSTPLAIHVTLGPRGELRAFHAHDALSRDEFHSAALFRESLGDMALEPPHEPTAERIAKGGVRNDGRVFKKARGADTFRAIDDLRRQRERARRNILAQGADGAESEEGAHAEGFECGYVRAGGDGRRAECVSLSMSGEESNLGARGKSSDGDW
jgi:hypothetical protein